MILDGLTLPDALQWKNEFEWNQVAQTQDRSVTGAILIQEQLKQYGREIELVGGKDAVWLTRTDLETLKSKEGQLNKKMLVTLPDGQNFTVMFNRTGKQAIQAEQAFRWQGVPDSGTWYALLTLRLITVEP